MSMLRWMHCKTEKDRIRNECIRAHLGLASIDDKLRGIRLKWFGHVQHRRTALLGRKSFSLQVDATSRKRGSMERTCIEVVRIYMKKCNLSEEVVMIDMKKCILSEDLTQDRPEWTNRVHVADPNHQHSWDKSLMMMMKLQC